MEKKFKDYFKTGIKNNYKTLFKKKRNFMRYYICFFIYILCIPLFILKPVINMATFRLGNQINEDNDIDLSSLTKSCDNPKNYFTALFAGIIKLLIIIGVILVLCVIAGVLAGIGYIIMKFTGQTDYMILLMFASPVLLIILLFIIFVPIMYAEIGYIVDANNDINASNALNLSFNAFKHEGKRIKFLILFVNLTILIGYLAIFGVVTALPILINGYSTVNMGLALLILVIVLIPFSILSPIFILGTISSITSLNDDVVKDTLTDVVSATNVKFHLPKKDIENLTPEEKLAYIFDKADGLKPSIKDLRILDSLDVVDEDGNYISDKDVKVEKEVEKPIEKPVEKQDKKEKKVEKTTEIENEEASKVVENDIIEESENIEETTWSDENTEQKDFDAIKELKDENIKDSIVEEVNSEKVSEDVTDNLEGNKEVESEDFEAMKNGNGEEVTETIKEDLNDEEPVVDEVIEKEPESETIVEENIPTDDVIEEIPQEEIIDEANEEVVEEKEEIVEEIEEKVEDSTEEIVEPKEQETQEETVEEVTDNKEETIEESNNEEVLETKEVIEDTPIEEQKEEKVEDSTEEDVLDEVEDLLNPSEEKQEEEFDMDLFNDKPDEDSEEINLEDFLKKGDE